MLQQGEGDGGGDDDDDDDDDPDDACHDDGEVVMISPSGREFPRRNLPARKVFSLSVVFVMKQRRKLLRSGSSIKLGHGG